ncbi:hypothetical protein B0H12DRAFT_738014 [Mycena haematopus]|nr:hypothetical protein B0H12DRAFT_738014 [Mycena haematopus]
MAFASSDLDTLREGPVSLKKAGILSSWRGWTDRWMVLNARSLTIYKNRVRQEFMPTKGVRIFLNSITRLERTHSSRKGHCLLLEAAGTRYFLACRSDDDLYDWHDKIYAISPLMLFNAGQSPEIDLEDIIRGYSSSADSPDLSSRPSTPRTLPLKMLGTGYPYPLPVPPQFHSQTYSPASSHQLLLGLDDMQEQKAPVAEPIAKRPTPRRAGAHSESHFLTVRPNGAATATEERARWGEAIRSRRDQATPALANETPVGQARDGGRIGCRGDSDVRGRVARWIRVVPTAKHAPLEPCRAPGRAGAGRQIQPQHHQVSCRMHGTRAGLHEALCSS